MALWMIAIDSQRMINFRTTMDPVEKRNLLAHVYKECIRGGAAKCDDEEWSYSPDGTLTRVFGHKDSLKYIWNGEWLKPADSNLVNYGKGKWNGLIVSWNCTEENSGTIIEYIFDENNRDYNKMGRFGKRATWRWTRHFLATTDEGGGEWIVEGQMPEPVVLMIQLIKEVRTGEAFDLGITEET